ncbi:MAG: Uma2 family endonuclease [bacterium]|nr:Uma2 family endonuclease [bacterium]
MLQTRLKLGLEDQGHLLSAEEFADAEFGQPYRYERVEGRLVVLSPSGLAHTRMISTILEHLYVYKHESEGIIDLIASESWIRTETNTDRMADIAVYLTTGEIQPDQIHEMVPDLVIEVVSEGSEERDYISKRREYYNLGILEYAIVDPFRKIITLLIYGERNYVGRELKPDGVFTSPRLPGLNLPLADFPWP